MSEEDGRKAGMPGVRALFCLYCEWKAFFPMEKGLGWRTRVGILWERSKRIPAAHTPSVNVKTWRGDGTNKH